VRFHLEKAGDKVPTVLYVAWRRVASPLTASLLFACIGCSRAVRLELKDTEGRNFTAKCDEYGCKLHNAASPGDASTLEPLLFSPGRLVGVCEVRHGVPPGTEPLSPSTCRALICDGDDACPPPPGLKRGTCVNGLCTEPSHELRVEDAVMLCLAKTGTGRESAVQVERYAMALNCGNPCRVPGPCLKP